MPKLHLCLDDGMTVDLGWHDAPGLYASVLGDSGGLHHFHGMRSATAALEAAWAVRDMLVTPLLLAASNAVPLAEARAATRYLFDLAYACHDHGVGGTLEVTS